MSEASSMRLQRSLLCGAALSILALAALFIAANDPVAKSWRSCGSSLQASAGNRRRALCVVVRLAGQFDAQKCLLSLFSPAAANTLTAGKVKISPAGFASGDVGGRWELHEPITANSLCSRADHSKLCVDTLKRAHAKTSQTINAGSNSRRSLLGKSTVSLLISFTIDAARAEVLGTLQAAQTLELSQMAQEHNIVAQLAQDCKERLLIALDRLSSASSALTQGGSGGGAGGESEGVRYWVADAFNLNSRCKESLAEFWPGSSSSSSSQGEGGTSGQAATGTASTLMGVEETRSQRESLEASSSSASSLLSNSLSLLSSLKSASEADLFAQLGQAAEGEEEGKGRGLLEEGKEEEGAEERGGVSSLNGRRDGAALTPGWLDGELFGQMKELQRFMRHHDMHPNGTFVRKASKSSNTTSSSGRSSSSSSSSGDSRRMLLGPRLKPTYVVAKDGSGKFGMLQDAFNYISMKEVPDDGRFVIFVKRGVYKERVALSKSDVIIVGEGAGLTKITAGASVSGGYSAYSSATMALNANRVAVMGLSVVNNAGPNGNQAIALRAEGDQTAFYQCSFNGYQDTLCPDHGRQFYRSCSITGTLDFIFGSSSVVLSGCKIYVRPMPHPKKSAIAASARQSPHDPSGIIIVNSKVYGTSWKTKAYLGRPWMKYARTVVMTTYLSPVVQPAGWLEWQGPDYSTHWGGTPYLAEYRNYGGGAARKRVWWARPGTISPSTAHYFSAPNFIQINSWIKYARVVPYP